MRRLALLTVLTALACAAPAHAAADLRIGIADDRILLSDPERAPGVVAKWRELGMQNVRVHVRWIAVAPADEERTMPEGFEPTDPLDPQYTWNYLDDAINLLVANGIEPILAVTGSGPLWSSQVPSRKNPRYRPDPDKFADFATAVARRYGDRVRKYIVHNEPNQPGWLQPQFSCPKPGRCSPMAAHIYRDIVNAVYPAIHAADDEAEVLVGALAPRGGDPTRRNRPMRPLTFIRSFGCLDGDYERVRTGPCRTFKRARMDGFAYHPHGVLRGPAEENPRGDEAAMADLPRLLEVLDRVQSRRGFSVPGGKRVALHLTEFGYQTRPPDPYSGVSPAKQKAWLQQSAYVAWANPRVKTLIQYEWEDEPIKRSGAGLGAKAYSGWQSGLHYSSGRAKPALSGFTHPFFADSRRENDKVRFWGQVRPGERHEVTLLRRLPGFEAFGEVRRITTDSNGYWSLRLDVDNTADYRFAYDEPVADAADDGGVRQPSAPRRVLSAVQRVLPPALVAPRKPVVTRRP